jgi:Lsr2
MDGIAYEIDLSAEHSSELSSMIGRYIAVARRTRPAVSRAGQQRVSRPRTQMDREQWRRIRSWARSGGCWTRPRPGSCSSWRTSTRPRYGLPRSRSGRRAPPSPRPAVARPVGPPVAGVRLTLPDSGPEPLGSADSREPEHRECRVGERHVTCDDHALGSHTAGCPLCAVWQSRLSARWAVGRPYIHASALRPTILICRTQ